MNLPSSQQGSQKAILLAGFILTLVLQLVPAQQQRLSVTPQPSSPKRGGNVIFSLQGAPPKSDIVKCSWARKTRSEDSVSILTSTPLNNPRITNGSAFSGRETLSDDCNLHIKRLRPLDTGNYSVTIETSPNKEKDIPGQTQTHTADFFLDITEPIAIDQKPQDPLPGQTVILSLPKIPKRFYLCEWSRQTHSGAPPIVQKYIPGQRNPQEGSLLVQEDCSLTIKDLVPTDAGSYIVWIEAPLEQSQEPGKETEIPERREASQVYTGKVTLKVLPQFTKDVPQTAGSASLSFSAGVIVAALFGSLAWADPLMTMFSMLFCPFASLRSKFFP